MTTELKGWKFLIGDINWEDYSGKWGKKAPDGSWYVLDFTNMEDAVGERELNETGSDRYYCEVKRVVLSTIPHEQKIDALKSCGWEFAGETIINEYDGEIVADTPERVELVLVETLTSYGCYEPLESFSNQHHADRARGQARRYAESLMKDAATLKRQLSRPVNKIGTTAEEYGRGDSLAGLRRYQEAKGENVVKVNTTVTNLAWDLMIKMSEPDYLKTHS